FAIEEMSRAYQARTNGIVLSTVIIAGVASLSILGSYTYFGVSQAAAEFPRDWLLVSACGLIGGMAGAGFSRATLAITRRIRRIRAASAHPRRMMLGLALGAGVITAVVGVATDGQTYGTGYEQARAAVEGHAPPLYYFAAKLIATLAATVSGIPGGLFAPSLSVGAGLGATIAALLASDVALAAVLGMAGYFAGVTQAPMTAFVIILEMTGNHANIVPIMAAAMIGYGTSRFISPSPLYHALSRLFIADVLRAARAGQATQPAEAQAPAEPPAGAR
ncbi:MAG: chloride channel protein, partial [Sphingomonadales bacterium]|nr:chloride channel protein [Sphingomonadales bacterium]